MPTYEYACKDCGEQLEVVQSFTDDALTTCPRCSGVLRKVFGNVGIVFKGSGFYKTDNRSNGSRSTSSSSEPSSNEKSDTAKSDTAKTDSSTSTAPATTESAKKESPAAAPAASSTPSTKSTSAPAKS